MSKHYARDSLGNRMKTYESVSKSKLMRRTPVIIRLDGKAFHTWTKGLERPFDEGLSNLMADTTKALCENIQNVVLAYTQSDEISLLLKDWTELNTEQWYDASIQKMVSVSASIATAYFNEYRLNYFPTKPPAMFDARVFNIPVPEVPNYFIWRQQDATRNSVQMLGQSEFSHKELQGKSNNSVQDMLMLERGINWNDIETWKKRGLCVVRKFSDGEVQSGFTIDTEIPIFTQNREFITKYL